MKQGLIITHGPIGAALIEAVQGIIGIDEGLYGISVNDMTLDELNDRIGSLIQSKEAQNDGVVIMACLKGGSCWNVSAGVMQSHDYVRLISGVNLPMVLSFVTKRDNYTLDELVKELEVDAIRGINHYERA